MKPEQLQDLRCAALHATFMATPAAEFDEAACRWVERQLALFNKPGLRWRGLTLISVGLLVIGAVRMRRRLDAPERSRSGAQAAFLRWMASDGVRLS